MGVSSPGTQPEEQRGSLKTPSPSLPAVRMFKHKDMRSTSALTTQDTSQHRTLARCSESAERPGRGPAGSAAVPPASKVSDGGSPLMAERS
jgi:hypothetical protein